MQNKRPKFHFTPESGWTNDPNGLIYIDGVYHLFYQHYPNDIHWGPMHWGHAISRDLINWEHKDIALYPDELGYIFSGSCVLDKENVSGFGDENHKALIAFYTSHNPDTGEQQQSMAYSLDYEHFVKYENNPIIKNIKDDKDFKVDFRDPKVFENKIKGGYTMVLSAGRHLEFYHSVDLINWNKTGVFDPAINGFYGVCECPDCFEISGDETKWILTLSSILEDDKVGLPLKERGFSNARVMQYFIGEFDGDTFIDTLQNDEPLILDYGTDNYAMVSFANHKNVIMLGWGEHWDYVNNTPEDIYRGKMTLAREVCLKNTINGFRLCFKPFYRKENNDKNNDKKVNILSYDIEPKSCVVLPNNLLSIKVNDDEITVERNYTYDMNCEILKTANYNVFSAKRNKRGLCHIDVICDEGYFEIFADDGLEMFSVMTWQ